MSTLDKLNATEADYWDCDDSAESLTHESPDCALEYSLDGWLSPGCDVEAIIRGLGPMRIWPWHREHISEGEVSRLAQHLLEEADEWLCENTILADPDEGCDLLTKQTREKHREAMTTTVRALCADASVWHCNRGEPITLSTEDVLTLMREHCPEWFEAEP